MRIWFGKADWFSSSQGLVWFTLGEAAKQGHPGLEGIVGQYRQGWELALPCGHVPLQVL